MNGIKCVDDDLFRTATSTNMLRNLIKSNRKIWAKFRILAKDISVRFFYSTVLRCLLGNNPLGDREKVHDRGGPNWRIWNVICFWHYLKFLSTNTNCAENRTRTFIDVLYGQKSKLGNQELHHYGSSVNLSKLPTYISGTYTKLLIGPTVALIAASIYFSVSIWCDGVPKTKETTSG